ncbi:uncharacterized protein Bfra_012277 [Botrytis fragariae]|uniref:DUF7918 domain-containing protein n=1 Tax=Botrytis fragariae TaxID=1964551 RepID=A0A8H6AJJ3_9HELO|nr:uncharacterized protein Bfra_012277 [Botrytis fragariae]KAF5868629.1 hypothetical protein Bfra_012277 [Botrytis fragariae]
MAVLKSLPGIEVTVCVDDKPLKEYENTEDEEMLNEPEGLGKKFEVTKHQRSVTVKKFVESTAGKFFTIKCSVKNPYRYAGACTHISFCSSIDGENLSWAPLFNKETYEKNSFSLTRVVEGNFYKEEGKLLLQRLQFTETQLTQWNNSIEAATRLDGNGRYVGEIEVRFFREMSPSKASLVNTAPLVSKTEIPENLLKGQAKSHSTLFSQGEAEKEGKYVKMKRCDGGRECPIGIFNFQYGSKGWRDLEALGIVERMPEPESSFGCGHDSERLPIPMSGPQAPEKLFWGTMKEAEAEADAKLSNNNSGGGSTSSPLPNMSTPLSIKQEVQHAGPGRNATSKAPLVPVGSSNVTSPTNSASCNFLDLDPTQTGQLFGQFLQYLQTQGGGQPSQAPSPPPVGTTPAALPSLSTSTSGSEIVTTATPKPPVKREKEGNENKSRKRRRKVRGKVTIDLTEGDSDDDVVIDLDSD